MSGEAILRRLAAGEQVPPGAVLQNARLHARGREHYGDEEILAHFAACPLETEVRMVTSGRLAVLHTETESVFAELAGAHLTRLWRLGSGAPLEREPAIAVPWDVDLKQAGGGIVLDPSDHPDLAAGDASRLAAAGLDSPKTWAAVTGSPVLRARPFCLRAFSTGREVAALFAVSVTCEGSPRVSGFVHAVAVVGKDPQVFLDQAGWDAVRQSAWRPRVA